METQGALCPSCSGALDPSSATYSEAGVLVCKPCASRGTVENVNRELEQIDPSTTRNLYLGAGVSALLAMATCLCALSGTWFFLASFMPIGTGVQTLRILFADATARARLGEGGYWLVVGLSVVAILFGLLSVVIGLALIAIGQSLRGR